MREKDSEYFGHCGWEDFADVALQGEFGVDVGTSAERRDWECGFGMRWDDCSVRAMVQGIGHKLHNGQCGSRWFACSELVEVRRRRRIGVDGRELD